MDGELDMDEGVYILIGFLIGVVVAAILGTQIGGYTGEYGQAICDYTYGKGNTTYDWQESFKDSIDCDEVKQKDRFDGLTISKEVSP